MYRWNPAPYAVFFFHDAQVSEEDEKVLKAIDELMEGERERTNIELLRVDVREHSDMSKAPWHVKWAWPKVKDAPLPTYLVVAPHGGIVHQGKLDVAAVQAMVASPAKKQLVKLLSSDNTAVYVMLTCKDEKANKKAEAEILKFLKAVDDGKIEYARDWTTPYGVEPDVSDEASKDDVSGEPDESSEDDPSDPSDQSDNTEEKAKFRHKFALLKIGRSDPKEKWFVRSLLAIESDLPELKEPMVFAVFGRSRALPPFVGKGISVENLIDCGHFLTGACQCTVKEQNPGVDLLTQHDWDATAEAMAERFGAEEGSRRGLSGLFPQVIIPGEDLGKEKEEAKEPEKEEQPEEGKEPEEEKKEDE